MVSKFSGNGEPIAETYTVDHSAFGAVLDESSPSSGDRMMGFTGGTPLRRCTWPCIGSRTRKQGPGVARSRWGLLEVRTTCSVTLRDHAATRPSPERFEVRRSFLSFLSAINTWRSIP